MLDFETTVKTRQSIRKFLPTPMTEQEIKQILADAQNAPSACNIQPWVVHIASGETLERLKKRFQATFAQGINQADFEFDQNKFKGDYEPRWREQYAHVFTTSYGIPREDNAGRQVVYDDNVIGYGAPHIAFLFMPSIDKHDVNIASDMGMYSQTFLLSLTARGFGGIPQLTLAMFADDVRAELGIPSDYKLLHAISFGYPDWEAMQNKHHVGRVPVEECATLHW
ncbi:nitroreductase [Wielerella bovis]|uniref:nitroreductase n=1 Tax=Wielerella bovis TaxID=2917790 RepID=UPI0020197F7C|nr:nitroreductase [Wielerella bovis]ULJ59696.1 nitroreductase [Wielerella bovis]ULJ61958.1 nitroreductase [Wielerella bovis]